MVERDDDMASAQLVPKPRIGSLVWAVRAALLLFLPARDREFEAPLSMAVRYLGPRKA